MVSMTWWRKGPKEIPEDRPPTDAETAHIMRSLADEFVQNARGADLFDYSLESVPRLDHLIDGLLEDASAADLDRGFSLGMGAYLGEVVVRNSTAARWVYSVEQRTGAIECGELFALPVFKVSKRFTTGPEHSLVQFVEVTIVGVVPPEARRLP